MSRKKIRKIIKNIRIMCIVAFVGVIGYGLYQVWYINHQYVNEEKVREQMEAYKPPDNETDNNSQPKTEDEEEIIVNQGIIDAQLLNPDIVGWVILDNTRIDYPFVQAANNDYYLRRNINGVSATAGTIFMDYRNQPDFTDFVTLLYGHNMRNGSMFADVRLYGARAFFEANETGRIHLPYKNYNLNIFAFLEISGDDMFIYGFDKKDNVSKQQFLSYVKEYASSYRDIEASADDRFVVLSTCIADRKEQRRVVIARIES